MEESAEIKIDFLTKCYVKEALPPIFARVKADCVAQKKPLSLMILDVDRFKSFNDKQGHLNGDELLKYFSSTMRIFLAQTESLIFRFGGDEFIILFPGKGVAEAGYSAYALQRVIKVREFLLNGRLFKISFSGGIATFPRDGEAIDILLAKADKAMYVSKKFGRGRTTAYSRIGPERIIRLAKVMGVVVGLFVIAFTARQIFDNYFSKTFERVKSVKVTFVPEPQGKIVTVYLKSGASFTGVIDQDRGEEIDLKLTLSRGEGSLAIKKSEIDRVEDSP